MNITIFSEAFIGEANGVKTAVLEAIKSLEKRDDITLSINTNYKDAVVIHAHSIGLQMISLALKYRKKMIVSAHVVPDSFIGSLIFSKLWRPLAKIYLKFVFNLPKLIIAVSPVVKSELEKIGVTTEIHVLCNSVDRDKFKPDPELRKKLREKYQIEHNKFVAICVGQIQPRKGIYEFLETARKCPDICFVWVGGRPYGRLTADFEKLSKAVEAAPKNVKFIGIIEFEEMSAHYAMADVYFLPSWQENFAFATIEASAVKLPLLLKDNIEYPSSLFTHYLKAKNAAGYAEVLNQLKNDSDFYKKYKTESDMLATKYEISTYTNSLVSIYKEIENA